MAQILIVEDDAALGIGLRDRLEREGFSVRITAHGLQGLDLALGNEFDLLILDVMLPGKSGFDICRDLRGRGVDTLILLLTAKAEPIDRVFGLRLGADDYLTKPFDAHELVARVEALLRRPRRQSPTAYTRDGLEINWPAMEVRRSGVPLAVSARELRLLRHLIRRAGAVVSRDELLREVWNQSEPGYTRTVDVHIASLRRKIEADPRTPRLIVTVPGFGYKWAG